MSRVSTGVLAAVVALLVRVSLLLAFPILPLGDGYARLDGLDRFVVGIWLPGYQAFLRFLHLLGGPLLVLRLGTVALDAAAIGLLAAVVSTWRGRSAALGFAWLLATSPVWVFTSIELRQEPLFLAVSALGLVLALERRPGWAGLVLAGACLVRYEAWLLGPVFLVTACLEQRLTPRQVVTALLPIGLTILAWAAYSRGISPLGARSLDIALTPARLEEQARMLWTQIPYWIGPPVLLALAGSVRPPRRAGVLWLTGAIIAHVALVAVLRPYSPFDTPRQLVLLTGLVALFASGLLLGPWPRVGAMLLFLGGVWPLARVTGDARSWFGTGTAAIVHQQALELPKDSTVLVLNQGWATWPDAESRECVALRAQRSGATLCDAAVEGDIEA